MKKGMGWPIGIAFVLTANVATGLTVMRIAANDPSFAVEPDYYRKAIEYDSTLAQARVNAELGWSARARIARSDDRSLQLTITLSDKDGSAIPLAKVSAIAMFVARAADADTIALEASGDGSYSGKLSSGYTGRWEIRVTADDDGRHFTSTLRTESPAAGEASSRSG